MVKMKAIAMLTALAVAAGLLSPPLVALIPVVLLVAAPVVGLGIDAEISGRSTLIPDTNIDSVLGIHPATAAVSVGIYWGSVALLALPIYSPPSL